MEKSIKEYIHSLQCWARIHKDGLHGVPQHRTREILKSYFIPSWCHSIEYSVQQQLHRRYRDDLTIEPKVDGLDSNLMFNPKDKKYAKN